MRVEIVRFTMPAIMWSNSRLAQSLYLNSKMGRKKKKNADFRKIQIKAGKKLPKHLNETKLQLKSKKIQLNQLIDRESIDYYRILSNNVKISASQKTNYLKQINIKLSNHNHDDDYSLTRNTEKLSIVAKFITDPDERVRNEVLKFLRHYLKTLDSIPVNENVPKLDLLIKFINSGLTHIKKSVRDDSEEIFNLLIKMKNSKIHHQLMQMFLMKIKSSEFKSLDPKWYENLRIFIPKLIYNKKVQENVSNESYIDSEEIVWSPDEDNRIHLNKNLSLDCLFDPCTSFDLTFLKNDEIDNSTSFYMAIEEMILRDVKTTIGREFLRMLSLEDCRKINTALTIIPYLPNRRKVNEKLINYWCKNSVPTISLLKDCHDISRNKFLKNLNCLLNQYRELCATFEGHSDLQILNK